MLLSKPLLQFLSLLNNSSLPFAILVQTQQNYTQTPYCTFEKKHIHLALVLIPLFATNFCNAQKLEKKFQFVLDSIYQTNKDAIGFMVHVESPDKDISWTSSVGLSGKNTTEKLHKNQPLLIASNTKTYISAAILKLVENRRIKLNQPIKKTNS